MEIYIKDNVNARHKTLVKHNLYVRTYPAFGGVKFALITYSRFRVRKLCAH